MELNKIGVIIAIAAGVLMVVGSIGPWVTADLGFLGSISKAGTDGDGVFTLILGIATAVLAGLSLKYKPKVLSIIATITASLAALIVIIDFTSASALLAGVPAAAKDLISFGWGIYLTLLASLAAVAGCAIILLTAFKGLGKVLPKKV